MDMLVVGLYGKGGPSSDLGGTGCTDTEYRTQMSLWAMMASPLAMSHDLRSANAATRDILLNQEVIAIDQDSLGIVAERRLNTDGLQVFVRPLSGGRHAVAILNTNDQPAKAAINFAQLGLTQRYTLHDPWLHRTVAKNARKWQSRVAAHETILLVLQ